MKKSHASFDISNYIPTNKVRDKIIEKLNECDLKYHLDSRVKNQFFKRLTLHPINNKYESYLKCGSHSCHFLRDGTISICPLVPLVYKFNNKYGLNYPTDETNILAEIENPWDLCENLNKPIDLCKYCSPYPELYDWKRCTDKNATIYDWLVDEKDINHLKHKYIINYIKESIKHPIAWGVHSWTITPESK